MKYKKYLFAIDNKNRNLLVVLQKKTHLHGFERGVLIQISTRIETQFVLILSVCLKHRLATRIWKGIIDENQTYDICECCGRKVGVQHVKSSFCYQSDQLSFLGVGLPLFFSYLRYSLLLLVILSVVFCIFGLYTNITSQDCTKDNLCKENIFNTLSIINKKHEENFLSIQNYILVVFVVLSIFIFQFFRYRFRKITENIDEYVASPSDYSLILKRLPEDVTEKDIHEMIDYRRRFLDEEEKIVTDNLRVQKIIMSYDLTEFNEERQSYLNRFKQIINEGQTKDFIQPNLPKPTVTAYIAIVVFSRQESKELFIQEPKCNQRALHYFFSPLAPLSDERIKDKRICIERAPEPDDIIWNNADVTVCQAICRKMLLGTVSLILLGLGGVAQYGIALIQKDIQDDTKRILIGTLASVVVTITNLFLQYFLIYTTYWERMNTVTQYMDVLNFKLVFQQFLNAGIFIVAANIAANYETFNLQGNLSQTIIQIMLLNAVTPNLSNFIMYRFDIGGKIMRYFCLQKKCSIYTQLEANYLYVLPEPFLPQKYSYVIKTVWLTAFYAPFTPVVVPISIIGLSINYCVQKYLFGGYYSAPNMISQALNNSCIELFEYVPLILSIGQFLIYMYFKKFSFKQVPVYWSVPIYISIAISLLNLIIPMRQLNMKIFKIQPDFSNQPTYREAQNQFEVTYELTNPAYQCDRTRNYDVKIWKKMFGHAPAKDLLLMGYKTDYSNDSNRKIMSPFLKDQSY